MKTWTIKSTSDPSKKYQVTMVTEWDWQCTCPHFVNRHVECKHIKGVQKAYDKANKQTAKSKPAPAKRQSSSVQSDNRRPGQERNSVPSGELRRSDSVDGKPAENVPGTQPDGSARHSSSSENAETSVGTPDVEPDVSRPAERSNPTPPTSDTGVRDPGEERQQLEQRKAEQQAKYEAWELRETHFSKDLHQILKQLEQKKIAEPDRAKIIDMQIVPIKIGIRKMNRKDWKAKPDFDTSLLTLDLDEIEPETREQAEAIQKNMF